MNINELYTDKKLELEGIWVDVGAGLRIKVARKGNPRYESFLTGRLRSMGIDLRLVRSKEDERTVEKVLYDAFARFILLDWEGLDEADPKTGKLNPVPYSEKKAREILGKSSDFFTFVNRVADERERFRAESIKSAEGNSASV